MRKLIVVTFAVLFVIACRDPEVADDDGGVDPDDTGCTALTPRSVELESFVGPTGLEARLGALIDGATQTLDVQMYLFTVKALADKIVAATARGVTVRVLLDPDQPGNVNVTPILTAGAVNWKNASPIYTYSHAKYLIIDGSVGVIMSMNFNLDAMRNERNYGVIDRDAEDLADLQAIFDQDWALANDLRPLPANLNCTRLLVSPTNSQDRLLDLIDSAKTRLDLEVMYVSDTSIRDAIGAASNRGVPVRIIINDPNDDAVTYFKSLGIAVKTPATFYLHAKLIMADQVGFVGSVNMSFTSLTKNREVGVLAFEPSEFAPIADQFEADWAASTQVQ